MTAAKSDAPGNAPTRKVHIKTYGCQMNVYDSERMAEVLAPHGFGLSESADDADVVILNTCHIREKAAEKVYSELGRLRELKEERKADGKNTVVAVAGCVAQAEGREITSRAPSVDLVVGPQAYHNLPDLIARATKGDRRLVETSFPEEEKFNALPDRAKAQAALARTGSAAATAPKQVTAFLTIQEGCDKFCSFCVVPYTRGVEYSREVDKIVAEAESLASRGVRELTLLGQNVNAYHGIGPDGSVWNLAQLMARLSDIRDIARIRYTTSHPRDMDDDLIAAHRDMPKVMPYLHLPFQAGSDRILAAMNRKHTAAEYLRLIDRIRKARPDLALSTDIIVGFPGETDREFEATMDVVNEVGFTQAYSFKYSPRPGTPAAKITEQVSAAVASERLQRLQALLRDQQKDFNLACRGRTLPVLLEKPGRKPGQVIGRSPYLQSVHLVGDTADIGQIIPVDIHNAGQNSLAGVIAQQAVA